MLATNPQTQNLPETSHQTLPANDPRRIRIMVVDDHEMVRNGLVLFLAAFDDLEYVGQAADGEGAINLAVEIQPDVILMDLKMAPVDGVAATRAIHEENPDVRILAMSAVADRGMIQEALDAGAAGFMEKTISVENLANAIRKVNGGIS